jgi:hypothetical protein
MEAELPSVFLWTGTELPIHTSDMTARDEVLNAAKALSSRSPDGTFTLEEVIWELKRRGTAYKESTIRTHVTSRMCTNAPDHHGTVYADLERLDRGRYRLT